MIGTKKKFKNISPFGQLVDFRNTLCQSLKITHFFFFLGGGINYALSCLSNEKFMWSQFQDYLKLIQYFKTLIVSFYVLKARKPRKSRNVVPNNKTKMQPKLYLSTQWFSQHFWQGAGRGLNPLNPFFVHEYVYSVQNGNTRSECFTDVNTKIVSISSTGNQHPLPGIAPMYFASENKIYNISVRYYYHRMYINAD